MSQELINRNADLKRLRDEGYFVQIRGGLLLLREVPYVNQERQVCYGTLISTLTMAGEQTKRPDTHVVCFDGAFPCHADGSALNQISNVTGNFDLGHGLVAKHKFSSKPADGYSDYYHKMTTYATILCGPAATLDPKISPRVFRIPDDDDEESVFEYTETASGRAGVEALSQRLSTDVLAIVGLGGSGSYVLDLVAKTPAKEIRLFDGDEFLQHNAFRTPGAASIEELREAPLKVDYLKGVYSQMHRKIVVHGEYLNADNIDLLDGVTFAILCLDGGPAKQLVMEKLEAIDATFIDIGLGLELDGDSLGGILRVTTSTPDQRDHVRKRVSFASQDDDGLYASNIQIADLNALNATLAVIKWKKLRGFYRDLEKEHHCTYTTDGNLLLNGDQHASTSTA
ncbi:MAG: ThiF family adenylyltransferase [Phycisphaerales bacterium]|nr:ThiF family adenylyltransferase [Phycisphaerales bacterium]